MTKDVYLSSLSRHIQKLPAADVKEILADYEEHFRAGSAAGKTDEQIIASLGQPKAVAQEILINTLVTSAESSSSVPQKVETVLRMLLLFLVLAPFNFIVFVWPFMLLVGFLLAGWAMPLVVLGLMVAGVAFALQNFGLLAALGTMTVLALGGLWTGLLGITVMMGIIMLLLTKLSLSIVTAFVKWNINFITARKA